MSDSASALSPGTSGCFPTYMISVFGRWLDRDSTVHSFYCAQASARFRPPPAVLGITYAVASVHADGGLICRLQSGPKVNLDWTLFFSTGSLPQKTQSFDATECPHFAFANFDVVAG